MGSTSYLGAYLRRQWSRLGAAKAAHAQQVHARLEKQWQRRAKELGYELKKVEAPPGPTAPA